MSIPCWTRPKSYSSGAHTPVTTGGRSLVRSKRGCRPCRNRARPALPIAIGAKDCWTNCWRPMTALDGTTGLSPGSKTKRMHANATGS